MAYGLSSKYIYIHHIIYIYNTQNYSGYAYQGLLPGSRGFDHFYGFYQGAIHYDNLKYIDIKYGDSNHFDFWEDGRESKIMENAGILFIYSPFF